MSSGRITLVLGRMPLKADPAEYRAAGPWCFSEQEEFFPDWDKNFTFAPEPLVDFDLQQRACREVKALCADTLPLVADRLCAHARTLPPAYWETLLTPWAMNVAKQVVERWWRVKAMVQAWGHEPLHVPLLPRDCTFRFATGPDFVLHGALGHTYNHWLFSRLLEEVFPPAWSMEYLPAVQKNYGEEEQLSGKEKLRDVLRNIMLRLPCPRLKGMSIGQSLRYSLALLHKSHGPDKSRPQVEYGSAATGIAADFPPSITRTLVTLFMASLPQLLANHKHPARLTPDPLGPRLRVASVLAYEDADYRQALAKWRGRGNRLMYVQHGSDYGQVRCVSDVEMVEYSQHAFGTWGWKEHQGSAGNFIPLPYPQLDGLEGRWQGKNGENLLFVGTEMPAFPYRLDAHPSPLQVVEYRKDKARFFEQLGRDLQAHSLYRPYFPVPGSLRDADWVLARFPSVRMATGMLASHLYACRLLVLDHNGTTLLESLVANIPMVLFWRREAWALTDEATALLDMLAQAGIWHETPQKAAAKAAEVWHDPLGWWMSDKVQQARREYCAQQALTVPGGPNPYWLKMLKSL